MNNQKERHSPVFSFFFNKKFLIYSVIGTFNTFNCVLSSSLLGLFLQKNLAFAIGYIISLTISYIFNSKFNFKRTLSFLRYSRFLASYIPNFIIQNVVNFIFLNMLGVHYVISCIIAALLGTPITFVFLKVFAFGDPKPKRVKIH